MKRHVQHMVRTYLIATVAMTALLPPVFANETNPIIVNEIAAYEKREYEWIEIFNRGDVAVDMEGWKFFENKTKHDLTVAKGTSLLATRDFAVIAEDAEKFLEKYPGFSKTVFDSSWSGLKESGEEIGLIDAEGETRELFTYISAPDTALERKNPWLDDFLNENWTPHAENGTPGTHNSAFQEIATSQENSAIIIKNNTATENNETKQTEQDTSSTSNDGQKTSQNMTRDDSSNNSPLPEQETSQNELPPKISLDDLKNIIISELVPNPAGSDTSEEWIEIANTSDQTIALQGLFLDDEEGGSKPFSLEKYTLSPYDFLIIKSRESKLSLKNSGDSVRLLLDDEKVLEEITYDDSAPEDESFARDEEGIFAWSNTTTPGAENLISESDKKNENADTIKKSETAVNGDLSKDIFFSEIFANPEGSDTSDEWIELANTGESDVNLGNWKIEEKGGKTHSLSNNLVIPADGWRVLYRTESGVSLNNSSEELNLFDFEGTLIDSIEYEKAPEEKSFAKIHVKDDDTLWEWTSEITEGDENPMYEVLNGIIEKMQDPTINGGLKSFLLNTKTGIFEIEYGSADLGNELPETLFIEGSEMEVVGKQISKNQYELKQFTIIQSGNPLPEKKEGSNRALPAALFGVPIAAFTMLNFPLEKIKNLLAGLRK